jgi:hypothetical protein
MLHDQHNGYLRPYSLFSRPLSTSRAIILYETHCMFLSGAILLDIDEKIILRKILINMMCGTELD